MCKYTIVAMITILCLGCSSNTNEESKRERFINMTKEEGLFEFFSFSDDFPYPELTLEEWQEYLDECKALKRAAEINEKEARESHRILHEMWAKLKKVEYDKEKFDAIYESYAEKYDYILSVDEGNTIIEQPAVIDSEVDY